MQRPALRLSLSVVLLVALSGCGAGRPSTPAPTVSSSIGSGEQAGDGAPHAAENTRYRERLPVAAASAARLAEVRDRVARRLDKASSPRTEADVRAVLRSTGAADGGTWIDREATGSVVFETQAGQDGCLIGRVPAASPATVEAAGFIRDDGCHALIGH